MPSPSLHTGKLDIPNIQAMLNGVLAALPPDPDAGPEGQRVQCEAATGALGYLGPSNPVEAMFAAHAVAAHYAALDAWRRASDPDHPDLVVHRLRGGARSLVRLTEDLMGSLERRQGLKRRGRREPLAEAAAAGLGIIPTQPGQAAMHRSQGGDRVAVQAPQGAAQPQPVPQAAAPARPTPQPQSSEEAMHLTAAATTATAATGKPQPANLERPGPLAEFSQKAMHLSAAAAAATGEPRPDYTEQPEPSGESSQNAMHLSATATLARAAEGAPQPADTEQSVQQAVPPQKPMHLSADNAPVQHEPRNMRSGLAAGAAAEPDSQRASNQQAWAEMSREAFAAHLRTLTDADLLAMSETLIALAENLPETQEAAAG